MTLIFNKDDQTGIRKNLRNNMNKSEAALWNRLKRSQTCFKFCRQYGIYMYVADFYCPKVKLVVEVDGISHYNLKAIAHDKERTKYFTSLGLHIKRYSAKQVFFFIDEVVIDIENTCRQLANDTDGETTPAPSVSTPPSQGGDSDTKI